MLQAPGFRHQAPDSSLQSPSRQSSVLGLTWHVAEWSVVSGQWSSATFASRSRPRHRSSLLQAPSFRLPASVRPYFTPPRFTLLRATCEDRLQPRHECSAQEHSELDTALVEHLATWVPHHWYSQSEFAQEIVIVLDLHRDHRATQPSGHPAGDLLTITAERAPIPGHEFQKESVQVPQSRCRSTLSTGPLCPGESGRFRPVHAKGTFKTLGVIG